VRRPFSARCNRDGANDFTSRGEPVGRREVIAHAAYSIAGDLIKTLARPILDLESGPDPTEMNPAERISAGLTPAGLTPAQTNPAQTLVNAKG